jgi:hypothetical protein
MKPPSAGSVIILTKVESRAVLGAHINVGYEVEGVLLKPLRIGRPIVVHRFRRNGVWQAGLFTSSPIVRLLPKTIVTQNSTYEYR